MAQSGTCEAPSPSSAATGAAAMASSALRACSGFAGVYRQCARNAQSAALSQVSCMRGLSCMQGTVICKIKVFAGHKPGIRPGCCHHSAGMRSNAAGRMPHDTNDRSPAGSRSKAQESILSARWAGNHQIEAVSSQEVPRKLGCVS